MSVSNQADPRANQKERTRAALVTAAAEMIREGGAPSVAEAAERAKVSRATAYRYFPTQESLMVEVAAVNPAIAPVEQMLKALGDESAEERLRRLLHSFIPIVQAEEVTMRTALRAYLDTWLQSRREGAPAPAVREGRRMRWLDQALAPVRKQLPPAQWRRLRAALSLVLGIEAIVVMKDVCHASDDETLKTLEWAAMALLHAGMAAPVAMPRGKR
ncbi:TetR/AcrR family transcriptional regulator [Aquabacterium sp.]|uniref:TetR/AcrR family transcriptional regulator n=1 Tax=Aquabacterium sp. TaxID=1872578 RepID=UPI002CA4C521|nr:helix-turn-helix domain-containing protein [Aquabacterium sp.]HSW02927.1 helix-turn-helix domain-containing protein [Aquabacterium sp.]